MRWILIFLLVIIEIILVLLILPVGARLEATQSSVVLFAKIFGINFKLYPRPVKKKSPESEAKAQAKAEKKAKKKAEAKAAAANDKAEPAPQKKASHEKAQNAPQPKPKPKLTFERIVEYISFAADAFQGIIRGIYISTFSLNAHIHNDDAAKTAMIYGGVCSALGVAIPKLERKLKVGKRDIAIYPEFEGESSFELKITIMAVPILLIAVAVMLYIKWNRMKQKDKAVQK